MEYVSIVRIYSTNEHCVCGQILEIFCIKNVSAYNIHEALNSDPPLSRFPWESPGFMEFREPWHGVSQNLVSGS